MKTNMYFGSNLNYLLEINKIQQVEIAHLTNKTRASVHQWIHKNTLPPLDTLMILSDYFSISIEELVFIDLMQEEIKEADIEQIVGKFLGSPLLKRKFNCTKNKDDIYDLLTLLSIIYK